MTVALSIARELWGIAYIHIQWHEEQFKEKQESTTQIYVGQQDCFRPALIPASLYSGMEKKSTTAATRVACMVDDSI